MAAYKIVPKVTYENQVMFSGKELKRLTVPAGVPAYQPIELSFGQMSKKEPSKVPAPAGLTVSEAEVVASGVSKVSGGGGGAAQWTFTGGEIVLNIQIGIFIIDKFAPVPDLLKLIMEHEYLHVRDTLNLAKQIGAKIEQDAQIKPLLNGDPWTGAEFFTRIGSLWGEEAKRLGNKLDGGAGYDKHKREIARLMPR